MDKLLEKLAASGTGEAKLKLLRDHMKSHKHADADECCEVLRKAGYHATALKLEAFATEPAAAEPVKAEDPEPAKVEAKVEPVKAEVKTPEPPKVEKAKPKPADANAK